MNYCILLNMQYEVWISISKCSDHVDYTVTHYTHNNDLSYASILFQSHIISSLHRKIHIRLFQNQTIKKQAHVWMGCPITQHLLREVVWVCWGLG